MACQGCREGAGFEPQISMAFQPIVDVTTGTTFAQEALVRGVQGQGAPWVLDQVTPTNRYAFDALCRVAAIEHAARLGVAQAGQMLSINFLPNAVYEPAACIRLTLATAARTGFPPKNLIFEFTENEEVDADHVARITAHYKSIGFKTAIDDFGAGFSGLTLLTRFQPDIVKLDMELIRGIDADPVRRAIVRNIAKTCEEIGVTVLGEGVETQGESETLREFGIHLQQGYVFARPAFESLADVAWPAPPERAALVA